MMGSESSPVSVLPEQFGTTAAKVLVDKDLRGSQALEAGMQQEAEVGLSGHSAAQASFITSRVGVAIVVSWAQVGGFTWQPS